MQLRHTVLEQNRARPNKIKIDTEVYEPQWVHTNRYHNENTLIQRYWAETTSLISESILIHMASKERFTSRSECVRISITMNLRDFDTKFYELDQAYPFQNWNNVTQQRFKSRCHNRFSYNGLQATTSYQVHKSLSK